MLWVAISRGIRGHSLCSALSGWSKRPFSIGKNEAIHAPSAALFTTSATACFWGAFRFQNRALFPEFAAAHDRGAPLIGCVKFSAHPPFPLETGRRTRQHQLVKLPRPACFLAGVLPLIVGCESEYTQLRVTNPRGEVIADWVARGHVGQTETGYCITALQRTDGYPYPITARYPDGWRVTVVGPNIHRWPCAKPAWLDTDSGK